MADQTPETPTAPDDPRPPEEWARAEGRRTRGAGDVDHQEHDQEHGQVVKDT